MLVLVAWLAVLVTTLWTLAGLAAAWIVSRRRVLLHAQPSPVSVLKPLSGVDAELEQNLATFFAQDHPAFELVFGVVDARDPALALVQRLAHQHPHVPCRIIVHAGQGALNPKIDNLSGLLPSARHDLVLLSDSNVRAPRHYVRELASLYDQERPGLVTNLFVGGRENSFGGALDSVALAGFCAAGVALPTLLGDALLIGKSALYSRSELDTLGGLGRLSDVLAEDFVLGKTFAHAGRAVRVAPTVLTNVTRGATLRAALARQLRWSMLRFRLRPLAALLEPLTSPLVMLPLAWQLFGPWALAWGYLLLALRDIGGWLVLRGPRRLWIPFALSPLRDLFALGVWCVAPLKHHVSWRGRRFRLGAGTLLYSEPRRTRSGPTAGSGAHAVGAR
jgi:ceramide glucosyltransferase